MGKRQPRSSATKAAPAAPAAASGLTHTGNKSSILCAAFSPTEYQLTLFASVIQGLDGQHLRIHDVVTGKLQCDHLLGPKESVTSLDWSYFPKELKDQPKKKRKRRSETNAVAGGLDQGDVILAFGTNQSDIRVYSPLTDKIIITLAGVHDKSVKDFKFTPSKPGQEGWSIGEDNKLVQWDLRTGQSSRIINLPPSSFTALSSPLPSNPHVICASQAPNIINIERDDGIQSFPAMRNPIHTVLSSAKESVSQGVFLASDCDRYINVFDPTSQKLVMNLVAECGISSLSLYAGPEGKIDEAVLQEKQVLAAVTEDGTIELFRRPFFQPSGQSNANSMISLKAKGKQMTRRADAALKITRSDTSDAIVPVVKAAFQGADLIVAWAEGGVIPVFERIKWLNENTDDLLFTGTKRIPKTKSSLAITGLTTSEMKSTAETQVDESKAVIEQGNYSDSDVQMQDSQQDDVSVSDAESLHHVDDELDPTSRDRETHEEAGGSKGNISMSDKEEDDDDEGEPSFGELVRASAANMVDVEAELEDTQPTSIVPGKTMAAAKQMPTGVSLSTVLSQSLKTNDSAMLESCFHTNDLNIIRTTIQRLDSSLAATLLQRLAERLSSRPSRYGHLLIWTQWTCVAHGGVLASRSDLLKRMNTLYKVMDQRSSSLPSLLKLKGKLDMLDAQLGLRQSLRNGAGGLDSEDEDNVIYVEGQEDDEVGDSDAYAETASHEAITRPKTIGDRPFDDVDETMANGIRGSDNDEVSSADEGEDLEHGPDIEDENQNIFDIEAEESASSSDAEEPLNESDRESDDDNESVDSTGSMADFIADSEDDESESDAGDTTAARQPPSKRIKRRSEVKEKGSVRLGKK